MGALFLEKKHHDIYDMKNLLNLFWYSLSTNMALGGFMKGCLTFVCNICLRRAVASGHCHCAAKANIGNKAKRIRFSCFMKPPRTFMSKMS